MSLSLAMRFGDIQNFIHNVPVSDDEEVVLSFKNDSLSLEMLQELSSFANNNSQYIKLSSEEQKKQAMLEKIYALQGSVKDDLLTGLLQDRHEDRIREHSHE